jgi:hypothetical protein
MATRGDVSNVVLAFKGWASSHDHMMLLLKLSKLKVENYVLYGYLVMQCSVNGLCLLISGLWSVFEVGHHSYVGTARNQCCTILKPAGGLVACPRILKLFAN